ncbi:hypothetical protein BDN70DRAFT_11598 [Pholiota conissans]|uniref:Uncharacterized protein n=1 Tax=Pholiota conissans TaxID=109636 RepID=A0A9P6D890_9AGAR|nr:hypothetical protein BDN70DRAFT_11598 [Pholiota conissans]
MLVARHPQSSRSPDPLARRGRSRQVAPTALARKASDERRSCAAVDSARRAFYNHPSHNTDWNSDAAPSPQSDFSDAPIEQSSPGEPSSRPLGYHSQRSSSSSIQSLQSTPSTSHTMPSIAAPVPLKAAFAPPFMRSASPSPPSSASMSPDYYDSPPSPPRSLEDQVHVAYALDDIHLAKILLLRLKGIEVTSDDDPRIAAVQDEDFDFCFVPNGRLMDEKDEKAMQEMQAREMALIEQRRRIERLRDCERKWEEEKRRMREERLAMVKRRERRRQEEEDARRRAIEEEQQRVAEEERRRAARERAAIAEMHRAARYSPNRKIVTYRYIQAQPPPPPKPHQFVYDFPGYTSRPAGSRPHTAPSTPAPQPPTFDDACAVPFADVLASMQGPLFPLSHDDRLRRNSSPSLSKSRSRTHSQTKRRREARLLQALLVDIEYSEDERRNRKGKQAVHHRRIFAPCLACSSASSSASPSPLSASTSSIPRTSSWLSFVGSASLSASSSTTDLTTPASSPQTTSKANTNWFSRPKSTTSDVTSPPLRHSCQQRTRLIPVSLSDSPLYIEPARSEPLSHLGRQRSTSTVRAAREGAGKLVRRMSKIVGLAKGLQTAYVNAALFSVSISIDAFEDRAGSSDRASEDGNGRQSGDEVKSSVAIIAPRRAGSRPKLRPAGYRVAARDVAKFLDPTLKVVGSLVGAASGALNSSNNVGRYIPLTSPFKPTETPRTVLPDPLPYKLVFKPVPSPSRSPFRFHALSELHTMYPSSAPSPPHMTGQVTWRIRSVGNPMHMRLKALHNVVRKHGMAWEGTGRDTALGGGRERVVGVAYENLGPTMLNQLSPSLTPK